MDIDDAVDRRPNVGAIPCIACCRPTPPRISTEALALVRGARAARRSIPPSICTWRFWKGESGRLDAVQRRVEEWTRRPDPLPAFAVFVAAAYLGDDLEAEAGTDVDQALAAALEPGWFRDRLAARLATRLGDARPPRRRDGGSGGALRPHARAHARGRGHRAGADRRRGRPARSGRRCDAGPSTGSVPPSCRRPGAGAPGCACSIWGGALGAQPARRALSRLLARARCGRSRASLMGAATNLSFLPLRLPRLAIPDASVGASPAARASGWCRRRAGRAGSRSSSSPCWRSVSWAKARWIWPAAGSASRRTGRSGSIAIWRGGRGPSSG